MCHTLERAYQSEPLRKKAKSCKGAKKQWCPTRLCAIETYIKHWQHLCSGFGVTWAGSFIWFSLQRTKTTHPQTFEKHDAQELEATGRPDGQEPVSQEPVGSCPKAQPQVGMCSIDICHTSECFQEQNTWQKSCCNCWDTTREASKPDEAGFPTSAICKAALSIKSLLARVNQSDPLLH